MTATATGTLRESRGCTPAQLAPYTWAPLEDAIRGNVMSRRATPFGYMELILTSDCNLHCPYCFEKDKVPLHMPEETALAAVDFLFDACRATKDVSVLFFGGEPMLRFDQMKVVYDYAARRAEAGGKRVAWSMTTNGTLIDEERAIWLADHGVKYLLSIDGGRDDHDQYRHFPDGSGTYDLLMERLPMLKRYQPWVGAKMSVTPDAAPRLAMNMRELHARGINQFIYGYAHGLNWTDDALLRYEAALYEVVELYLEMKYKRQFFRITSFEEDSLCGVKPSPFGCGAGRGRFCVDPFGDIYGCSKLCTILGPGKGVLPLGNVFQGVNNAPNRLRCFDETDIHRHSCRCCEYRADCCGGCPALNYASTGSVFLPDKVSCKMTVVGRRVDDYARKRHDEVFGTQWSHADERSV